MARRRHFLIGTLLGGFAAVSITWYLSIGRPEPWPHAQVELLAAMGALGGFLGFSISALQLHAIEGGKSVFAMWVATIFGATIGLSLPSKEPFGMAIVLGMMGCLTAAKWGPHTREHEKNDDDN